MTFLLETTVPILVLLGACLVSMGLVLLLMTLGMPDEKKYNDDGYPVDKNGNALDLYGNLIDYDDMNIYINQTWQLEKAIKDGTLYEK
tara:strand:- start:26 stop:289 length:264 start_codon:yes stop_codon:yes gene_type:complete